MSTAGKLFSEVAETLVKRQQENPAIISWLTSYNVSMVPEEFLFELFDKAMPHKVVAADENYGNYDPMDTWIKNNCKCLTTHVNIHYWFEDPDEAMKFKLVWG